MSVRLPKEPFFDPKQQIVVVPGQKTTIHKLAGKLLKLKDAKKLSAYRIAKETGLTRDAVLRLFSGYMKVGKRDRETIRDPHRPGRVRLETALAIVQALGADIEIVSRETLGRSPIL